MELKWVNILIEIGFFLGLALLYYIYQKKKIIRFDKIEIYQMVEDFTIQIHYFLENQKTNPNRELINELIVKLEKCLENDMLDNLPSYLEQISKLIPRDLNERAMHILETIDTHKKL